MCFGFAIILSVFIWPGILVLAAGLKNPPLLILAVLSGIGFALALDVIMTRRLGHQHLVNPVNKTKVAGTPRVIDRCSPPDSQSGDVQHIL